MSISLFKSLIGIRQFEIEKHIQNQDHETMPGNDKTAKNRNTDKTQVWNKWKIYIKNKSRL